ncbi:MAG: aminodeoxychorismate/anthranilate synthase component II [Planctomycetota bacterium]
MIAVIDNYDSFVHNLARYLNHLGRQTEVVRNDAVTVAELAAMEPEAIVISPGPCTPREAGISCDVVRQLGPTVPVLGVCLGHQAIAAALGGVICRAAPVHGRSSFLLHDGKHEFLGCANPFEAGRYHSLIIDRHSLPRELAVSAWLDDHTIMAIRHHHWPLRGWQFHPESILTPEGDRLLANWLRYVDRWYQLGEVKQNLAEQAS